MSIVTELSKVHSRAVFNYDNLRWTHAARMAKFQGGTWLEHKLPNGLSIDYSDSFPVDHAGEVRLSNPMNGNDASMDAKSAGAAITILALAHTVEGLYERLSDEDADTLITLLDNIKGGVFDDKTLNHSAIFRIID